LTWDISFLGTPLCCTCLGRELRLQLVTFDDLGQGANSNVLLTDIEQFHTEELAIKPDHPQMMAFASRGTSPWDYHHSEGWGLCSVMAGLVGIYSLLSWTVGFFHLGLCVELLIFFSMRSMMCAAMRCLQCRSFYGQGTRRISSLNRPGKVKYTGQSCAP